MNEQVNKLQTKIATLRDQCTKESEKYQSYIESTQEQKEAREKEINKLNSDLTAE